MLPLAFRHVKRLGLKCLEGEFQDDVTAAKKWSRQLSLCKRRGDKTNLNSWATVYIFNIIIPTVGLNNNLILNLCSSEV